MIINLLHSVIENESYRPHYYFYGKDTKKFILTPDNCNCLNHYFNHRTQREEKNYPDRMAIRLILLNIEAKPSIRDLPINRRFFWSLKKGRR